MTGEVRPRIAARTPTPTRAVALAGTALLIVGFLSTLYWVTAMIGGTTRLLVGVAAAVGAAVLLRNQREEYVLVTGAALSGLAVLGYFWASGADASLGDVFAGARDTVAMTSGISIDRIDRADVWIAVTAPVPVFLSTYFAVRRRYALAVTVAAPLVLFLAATGDAAGVETLVAVIGAVVAVGFGELERRDGTLTDADGLVVLLAGMVILGLLVPFVPSGSAAPLDPASGDGVGGLGSDGGSDPPALDDQLLDGDSVNPDGPVELSPEVAFVVESDEPARWRVGVLDRYDGDGWKWAGDTVPYRNPLRPPPGESRTVTQEVQVHQPGFAMPHAANPQMVLGEAATFTQTTDAGTIVPGRELQAGESYTVRSEIPTAESEDLATAGRSYPDGIEERYTQLPDDLPERVENVTERVTRDATANYDKALAIESYLSSTKTYSLDVEPPAGDMADGFLFEMEAGYCTYFAGTMATMLRTQGVPARVAVGYNAGQWVDEDTRVVRGTDAHAWVEVYYPGVGWIEHDPTPESGQQQAHSRRLEQAREAGESGVDVPESEGEPLRFEPPSNASDDSDNPAPDDGNVTDVDDGTNATNGSDVDLASKRVSAPTNDYDYDAEVFHPEVDVSAERDERAAEFQGDRYRLLDGLELPLLGAVVLVGVVGGVHRTGVDSRVRTAAGAHWQRRRDPETDVQRALERVEWVLERRYRPRAPGETPRAYLTSLPEDVDPRVRRIYGIHERTLYAGSVEREAADEAIALADELTRESLPVVGGVLAARHE